MRTNSALCLLFAGIIVCSRFYEQPTTGQGLDIKDVTADEIWNRLIANNRVWLQPTPRRLSYVVTGTPTDPEGGLTETTDRVWLSGNQARWEMEVRKPNDDEIRTSYVLVVDGNTEQYLDAPKKKQLLGRSQPARDILPLRQGITWKTSLHVLAQDGLPDRVEIVERRRIDGGHVVVLECDLGKKRWNVGIGLYHSFKGQMQAPIGKVRIHIKTPEFIPLKEELLTQDVTLDYSPDFMVIGEQLAPRSITLIGKLFTDGSAWILEARFRAIDNCWLLDRAFNIQNGEPIVELVVSDVSTDAVDRTLFEVPNEQP